MQGPRKDSLLSQPLGCLLAERDHDPVDHRVCTGSCDATASYFQSEECLSRVISGRNCGFAVRSSADVPSSGRDRSVEGLGMQAAEGLLRSRRRAYSDSWAYVTGSCVTTASYFQTEECLSRVISYGVLLEITGGYGDRVFYGGKMV